MLTKLALQNFKAWERCSIGLGRITVLIGPNGSGKSSILQALGFLKQSRNQKAPVWNGPYQSLGRFEDVIHRWGDRRSIRLELDFASDEPLHLPGGSGEVECSYALTLDNSGPVEHRTVYSIGGSVSVTISYEYGNGRGSFDTWPTDLLGTTRTVASSLIAAPLIFLDRPSETHSYRAFRDFVLNHLVNTYSVKTQRPIDAASYMGKPGSADFTEPGDVANFVAYNDETRWLLSDWLSQMVEEDVEVSVSFLPDYRIALELRRRRESTNIAHEGAGIQSIIWPLAQIAAAPIGSLIALEEPEVHLHPKAQARVGQVLTEVAHTTDKQILVTSQSEHILMSFLTEAVKSGASPDDFRVYYCVSNNRVAEIEELRLDPNGGLDGGLKGFFEANFDETQRFLEALTERNTG